MGEILAVTSALCFGLSEILAQRGMREASAPAGVIVALICNNITFGLLLVWQFLFHGLPSIGIAGVLFALGGGLAGNVLGRTFNYSALKRIGSARAVSLALTQTLFAFLYSAFLLSEAPNRWSMVGIVLIVGGVLWLSREQIKLDSSNMNELAVNINEQAVQFGDHQSVAKKTYLSGPRFMGVILALLAGFAYSLSDLLRKLSLRVLPSAVLCSAIGGFCALVVYSSTFCIQKRWGEISCLSRRSMLSLVLGGTVGGLAILFLNSALSLSSIIVVNTLFNIRVLVPLFLGPILLGKEGRVNVAVVSSTILILAGTILIMYCK